MRLAASLHSFVVLCDKRICALYFVNGSFNCCAPSVFTVCRYSLHLRLLRWVEPGCAAIPEMLRLTTRFHFFFLILAKCVPNWCLNLCSTPFAWISVIGLALFWFSEPLCRRVQTQRLDHRRVLIFMWTCSDPHFRLTFDTDAASFEFRFRFEFHECRVLFCCTVQVFRGFHMSKPAFSFATASHTCACRRVSNVNCRHFVGSCIRGFWYWDAL